MTNQGLVSIPGVCEVRLLEGPHAEPGRPADLLLEVPHGATRAAHFAATSARLRGALPEDLSAFFFVNTDVGAPEVALRVAERVTTARPAMRVLVVVALVPRTFVDFNRVPSPEGPTTPHRPGGMTPGMAPYVRDPADRAALGALQAAYVALVDRAYAEVCGGGGRALMVHTYAPRSVDVAVDDDVVASLRAAYRPEVLETWPLRPPIDLITTTPDGVTLADRALARRLVDGFGAVGLEVAQSHSYHLHPASMSHRLAARHPDKTLCLEIRRDLLVREFTPFVELEVDPVKVDAIAAVIAAALRPAPVPR